MDGPESSTGCNAMRTRTSREYHRERHRVKFVVDESCWSWIRPCLSLMDADRRLRMVDVG